jgi:hypothetical protein
MLTDPTNAHFWSSLFPLLFGSSNLSVVSIIISLYPFPRLPIRPPVSSLDSHVGNLLKLIMGADFAPVQIRAFALTLMCVYVLYVH